MGNISKSCFFYLKDNDDFEEATKSDSNIEPIINMRDNKKEEENFLNKKNECQTKLFKNQFNSNPLQKYNIISELSPYFKIIAFRDIPKITRLMIIMTKKGNIINKRINESFFKNVEDLQLLEHFHMPKFYEVYIYKNNYEANI